MFRSLAVIAALTAATPLAAARSAECQALYELARDHLELAGQVTVSTSINGAMLAVMQQSGQITGAAAGELQQNVLAPLGRIGEQGVESYDAWAARIRTICPD